MGQQTKLASGNLDDYDIFAESNDACANHKRNMDFEEKEEDNKEINSDKIITPM